MKPLKVKISSKHYKWKLSKREFGLFRRKHKLEISYEYFLNHLDNLYVHYLNGFGLSVNADGSPVEKESAKYMWAQLEGYKTADGSPLYVWMYQKENGKFGNIAFGTRMEFDKIIARDLSISN